MRAEVVPLDAIPGNWDEAWDALSQNASEPNAFAERWFMRASIAHLSPPPDGCLVAVWEGFTLTGIVALCNARGYARLPVRYVRNWLHYHSFLGTPLVARGSEQPFWTALLDLCDRAEWASSFLHLTAISRGPVLAALAAVRQTDIVQRSSRAFLGSALSSAAYIEAHIRPKKRKELRRLRARLEDRGAVAFERTRGHERIGDFLALEASGWKGRTGSALARDRATHAFGEAVLHGAAEGGRLEMLTMTLDGAPIAMLANFMTPPGGFSFKIAYDERYARYSPGVLLQLENMTLLDRGEVAWMDSCAIADHAMINSLWAERREIVSVTVPLKGARRRAAFAVCRTLERGAAAMKRAS